MQSVWKNPFFIAGIIVGLLFGLFIGWVLWPVHYINAYPADLRHSDKVDYILLVSREFQRTGDWQALQRRLSTFPKKDLPDLFVEARKTYADHPEYTDALDATWKFISEHGNLTESQPSTEEATSPPPAEQKKGGAKGLAYLGLLVILIIIALSAIKLYQWIQGQRSQMPAPMARDLETESYPPQADTPWDYPEPPVIREEVDEGEEPFIPEDESLPTEERPISPSDMPPSAPSFPEAPPPEPVEQTELIFMIEAHRDNEQTFDLARTIYLRTPDGEEINLGEYGLSETESYQGQAGRPTVMEIWLFDKHDPISPVQAYILSPWAYAQADLREKYKAKGKVILARPNTHIRLQTYALELDAEIKDVAFAQLGRGEEVFKKLGLLTKIYRRVPPQSRT